MAKIARQNFKVFGLTGDTADFAKFGSQEAAAPVKTKDIELIQSLEAWDKGWADAIVDANKAPYMEDMNAAMYVFGYQLGYVLQEGIPEWDDGTTYYAESIVKKTTTQELYASKTNDNVGNALPDKVDNTDWKYLIDLGGNIYTDRGDPAAFDWDSNLTADGAWHDLDLSSIVPVGAKAVLLTIGVNDATVDIDMSFRPNGNSNIYNISRIKTQVANITVYADITTACDSDRIIEYQIDAALSSYQITVKGWWK